MTYRVLIPSAAAAVALILSACGDGSGNAPLTCSTVSTATLGIPGLNISSTKDVAARTDSTDPSANYPAHCQLQGNIAPRTGSDGKHYAIGFELRLPNSWNGKFFFQGGGGTDGAVNPALGSLTGDGRSINALSLGYSVVSTDGGHTSEAVPAFTGSALFGLDPQARIDYGYNAVGSLTPLAKQIVASYYAAPVQRSYFVGCSNGGRQAMVAASRFGDQFDGIIAGDPGFNLPKAAVAEAWDTQQFVAVSGNPLAMNTAFSIADMKLVGQRILAKCDALDGASDGMVSDISACQAAFNLATDVPTCTGAANGTCLTATQKTALQKIMDGPKNGAGQQLYSSWPWDPGIAASAIGFESWRAWKLENPILGGLSINVALGGPALPYIFTTPPTDIGLGVNPADTGTIIGNIYGYMLGFNFDTDAPKIFATNSKYTESAMSFMTPPNPTSLSAFKSRGKLMVYHGGGDPVFSANDTIRWYNELSAANTNASDFARLFLVPGMGHCGGGVATDQFDMFSSLVQWVESATPPDSVIASARGGANTDVPASWSPTRSRPLCAYPKRAVLKPGATDLETAASFICQ